MASSLRSGDAPPPEDTVASDSPARQPLRHPHKPYAAMECERWLHARLNDLRMRSVLDQKAEMGQLPQKVEKCFVEFNANERNIRGETLIMSVIRYEPDKSNQIRYINTLVRSGCDPSATDTKQLRTPLMIACLMKNDTIAQHLIMQKVNLTAADRLGNTALMYAALYSQSSLVALLTMELARRYEISAFRVKNLMGYTAESLARKNERYMFSMMLKKERLKMLKKLREQASSYLRYSSSFHSWTFFAAVYKAKSKFLSLLLTQSSPTLRDSPSPDRPIKINLPALEQKMSSNGEELKKSRSESEIDLRSVNLPKLSLKGSMRSFNEKITSKLTFGLSAVCPNITTN